MNFTDTFDETFDEFRDWYILGRKTNKELLEKLSQNFKLDDEQKADIGRNGIDSSMFYELMIELSERIIQSAKDDAIKEKMYEVD